MLELTGRDPFEVFAEWFAEAERSEVNDPEAMTLATADGLGRPAARVVLLKGVDARGFVFYTNTQSRKGLELAANPQAALLFHWKSMRRQVRVSGPVDPVDQAEADAYFHTRPRGSQIGAWASQQSQPCADRATLTAAVAEAEARFENREVPRPEHWSGYRIRPLEMEFWQNGEFRLHDRFLFERDESAARWRVTRLYP